MKKYLLFYVWSSIALLGLSGTLLNAPANAAISANGGVGSSGGGDAVKLDFLVSAHAAYDLLLKVGHQLNPPVAADRFGAAIDPARIFSTDTTLTYQGHVVDAYYDEATDLISINKKGWQSILRDDERLRLAAHEIFRRIGINDNLYQISGQLKGHFDLAFNMSRIQSGDYVSSAQSQSPKTCWMHLEKRDHQKTVTASFNKITGSNCADELLGFEGTTLTLTCDPIRGLDCQIRLPDINDPLLGKAASYVGISIQDSHNYTLSYMRVSLHTITPEQFAATHAAPCYYSTCTWSKTLIRTLH